MAADSSRLLSSLDGGSCCVELEVEPPEGASGFSAELGDWFTEGGTVGDAVGAPPAGARSELRLHAPTSAMARIRKDRAAFFMASPGWFRRSTWRRVCVLLRPPICSLSRR